MAEIASLLLLGVFSGFIAGLLGVGGGLIIVPALLYLLAGSVDQAILMHTAVGTALAAIVFTSISSVRAHQSHGAIHWHNFKKLTPTILLGAFSGALLTKLMSFDFMRIFFAFFEFGVAIIMFFGVSSSTHVDHLKTWVWRVTGYIIGLVSAIVGIGGGTMTTPFLTYNNVDIKNAIATSAAVGMPIAIAGALGFIVAGWGVESIDSGLGFIHTEALISIVVMSVLFAPLGARVAHSVDGKKLKKFFAIFLAFLGLAVITF
ncbi:MAG: sulfite exporter TauE/SafE family protein [Candidatus Thioglobus sp.]|nr:sulfite exporter TauE/SafE family protein [Candidatus Thioglobus pontius]MBL6976774.1 sulfite exporter TauE/SafE family protein [Candidatus Thioglobus sp.]MBL6984416.1 sulfite exporter TauE/SafE family protein [Candidatus Thioglobus sp.]